MRLPVCALPLLAALLCSAPGARAQEPASIPWEFETVDSTGDVGTYTALDLDQTGTPHVCYHDVAHAALKYAVLRNGTWQTETVDADGVVGRHLSMALDSHGRPHASYFDETRGDLKYATLTPGGWVIERVDTTETTGQFTAIALDTADQPHVSYHSVSSGALRYAVRTAGAWHTETVDSVGTQGQWTSIAVGADGTPHISYYDATYGNLKYAVRTAAGWSVTVVDSLGNVGLYTSIRLDSSGLPRIAYTDFGAISMSPIASPEAAHGKHVKFTDYMPEGFWRLDIADAIGLGSQYVSMRLDSGNEPHIAYFDYLSKKLLYTVRHGDLLGWTNEFVGEPAGVGDFPSLALDADDNPHLAYYDVTAGRLRYATTALRVTAPLAGDTWYPGTTVTATWKGQGPVDVSLSTDGGSTWETLQGGVVDDSLSFPVPGVVTGDAWLRVERASPPSQATAGPITIGVRPLLSLQRVPLLDGASTITLAVPPDAPGARLELWDVRGRRLAILVDGAAGGEIRTVTWTGRGDGSRVLPAGVYVLRAVAGTTVVTRRIVAAR